MSRPSWQDFGTHDESAYPELWDGVIGAWAPCLGPTGSRLHDMSRRSNWGTLTNMDNATDWVIDGGQYALNFDGSNNRIDVGAIQLGTRKTISCWIKRNGTETAVLFSVGQNIVPAGYIIGLIGSDIYNNNSGVFYSSAFGGLAVGRWEFLAIATDGANYTVYVNGVQKGTMQDAGANLLRNIGSYETGTFPFSGRLDDIAIWNRRLTASEIRQLYQLGRGGMYQRRRRRAIYLPQAGFQAAWTRGSNVMLGFNQP